MKHCTIKNMKYNNFLIAISVITLFPVLILSLSSFVTHSILIPLEICHAYNGSDFGSSAICGVVPAFSYFGFAFLMLLGGVGFLKLLGYLSVITYYIRVFRHNRSQSELKFKYSKVMMILVCLIILVRFFLPLITMNQKKVEMEEVSVAFVTPTLTHFVCDEANSIDIESDGMVVLHIRDGARMDSPYLGIPNPDTKAFDTSETYKNARMQYSEALRTCKNSQGKSVYDIYSEQSTDTLKGELFN